MLSHWEDDFPSRVRAGVPTRLITRSLASTRLCTTRSSLRNQSKQPPATTAGMSRPLYGINKAATAGYSARDGRTPPLRDADGYAAGHSTQRPVCRISVPDERRARLWSIMPPLSPPKSVVAARRDLRRPKQQHYPL